MNLTNLSETRFDCESVRTVTTNSAVNSNQLHIVEINNGSIMEISLDLIECNIMQDFVDSLFAYFQFPFEGGYDDFLDTLERIVSAPILALAIKSFALT
jgi:hypothetical protein